MNRLILFFLIFSVYACGAHTKPADKNDKADIHQSTVNQELYYQKILSGIPEIQTQSKEIEKLSQGKVKLGILIEFENAENSFYPVKVFESHADHTVNIWAFRIHQHNFQIDFYDVTEDKYIPLADWQKK